MSKFIALITAALTALTARLKRAEARIDVDPYEGYEVTEQDVAWGALGCPWECGECRYCRQDREPDQG